MMSIPTAVIIAFLASLVAALGWELGKALFNVLDEMIEAALDVTVGKWMERKERGEG